MMTEQQQVAMIRTMLYFVGKSQYQPTSSAVLTELRQMSAAATTGWDLATNKAPSSAAPQSGWDLKSNKKV